MKKEQEIKNNESESKKPKNIVAIVWLLVLLLIIVGFLPYIVKKIFIMKHIQKDYMLEYRYPYSATQLKDGRILIIGGSSKPPEIYDPKTRTSTYTGNVNITRDYELFSIPLNDGRVLIIGGNSHLIPNTDKAEIYDPKTGKFSILGDTSFCKIGAGRTIVKLNDESIFMLCPPHAFIYNPIKNIYKKTPDVKDTTWYESVTVLSNGDVMIVGNLHRAIKGKYKIGYKEELKNGNLKVYTTLIYNPQKNTYRIGPDMALRRNKIQVLDDKDGNKIFFGGYQGSWDLENSGHVNIIEKYDPVKNRFINLGKLKEIRNDFSAVVLPNGKLYFPANNLYKIFYNPYNLKDRISKLLDITQPNCEVFDPETGESHYTPVCLDTFKYGSKYFVQPDGKLIIVGGGSPLSTKKQRREIITIDTKEIK